MRSTCRYLFEGDSSYLDLVGTPNTFVSFPCLREVVGQRQYFTVRGTRPRRPRGRGRSTDRGDGGGYGVRRWDTGSVHYVEMGLVPRSGVGEEFVGRSSLGLNHSSCSRCPLLESKLYSPLTSSLVTFQSTTPSLYFTCDNKSFYIKISVWSFKRENFTC